MTEESRAKIIEGTKIEITETIEEITDGIARTTDNMDGIARTTDNMDGIARIMEGDQEDREIFGMVQNSVVNVEPVNFGSKQDLVDSDVRTRTSPLKFLNSEGTEITIRSLK